MWNSHRLSHPLRFRGTRRAGNPKPQAHPSQPVSPQREANQPLPNGASDFGRHGTERWPVACLRAIVVAVPLATPRKAFSPHSAQPAALRFPRQLAAIPSRERRRFCPPTLRNACNAAGGWGDQAALDSAAFRNLVELCSGAPMHWTNQRLRARATWNDWEVRRERLNSLRLGSLSRAIES